MESKAGFRLPVCLLPVLKVLFQNNLSNTLLCGNMCVCVKFVMFRGKLLPPSKGKKSKSVGEIVLKVIKE